MKMKLLFFFQIIGVCQAILLEETGKDLPTSYNNRDIILRKKRPLGGGGGGGASGCTFNGIKRPKSEGTGRTFFDFQFLNVGYHQNYNINCGDAGGSPVTSGIGHPVSGGNNPVHGSQETYGGILSHKPSKPLLSMILANRPLQGLFSQSQSQTQTQTGILGDAISGIAGLLPKPQDIGQGLGEGLSSFIQTLPQIGQSFQSLLPSFDNFQLPSLPALPPIAQAGSTAISGERPPVPSTSTLPNPSVVTPVGPDPVSEPTVDPDDIIFNDNIKPVHEDPDIVAGPNKLPPGSYYNRPYNQIRYQSNKNYYDQKISAKMNRNKYHYQQSRLYYSRPEPRYKQLDIYTQKDEQPVDFPEERLGSQRFQFPTQ